MKHFLLSIFLLSTVVCQADAQFRVGTDERQELSAIVWRLAGAEEYAGRIPASYAADIDTYFADFKQHPVTAFIREMRDAPDSVDVVSYNSVPAAAVLLQIERGRVRLNPSVDLKSYLHDVDPRWSVENLKRYVRLLNDFYRDSRFDRFFSDHAEYYAAYEADMRTLLEQGIRPEWFEQFYGRPFPELTVCVSPAYGVNNFWFPAQMLACQGHQGIEILIGRPQEPGLVGQGLPHTLLHEISHYFTDPVFSAWQPQLTAAGESILQELPRMLSAAGYGTPEVVCSEFLNDLCTMMYEKEVLGSGLYGELARCRRMGFIWAEEGVEFMENFSRNRDRYPTLAEFMPQLAGFMQGVAGNIGSLKRIYNEPPFVLSVYPAPGSVVPSDLKEVRVRFSHPMNTGLTALNSIEDDDILTLYDEDYCDRHDDEDQEYWADERTFVIRNDRTLLSGKRYGIILPKELIKENGVQMAEDYEIIYVVQ